MVVYFIMKFKFEIFSADIFVERSSAFLQFTQLTMLLLCRNLSGTGHIRTGRLGLRGNCETIPPINELQDSNLNQIKIKFKKKSGLSKSNFAKSHNLFFLSVLLHE